MTDIRSETYESIECIDIDLESKYLLNAMPSNKSHTLVLDIDETLLSVRRWVDEIQIDDRVLHIATNTPMRVTKITKEVTLQFDDGSMTMYSFYFNEQQPFGQLSSSLDVGDRMDIGDRLASVKEVFTSYVTIWDESNGGEISLNCIEDDYLHKVQYLANQHSDSKFSRPDLVYDNLYVVRFRNGLSHFFQELASYPSLEVVLWTAAVRSVYTGLMKEVHRVLTQQIQTDSTTHTPLWDAILYRDNCSARSNGSYFKDLSLLNRRLDRVVMIDNIWHNFEGFEYNGLPINEYWGHCNDSELVKLEQIINVVMDSRTTDVRGSLHRAAYDQRFSTFKLDSMLRYLNAMKMESKQLSMDSVSTPELEAFDQFEDLEEDEMVDVHMEFEDMPTSSASEDSQPADSFMSHEATDSSTASMPSISASINNEEEEEEVSMNSMSHEDSDQLDFYLFNFTSKDSIELDSAQNTI